MVSGLGVRVRFTMMYGVALIITILLLSGGIYFFVQQALIGQVENHLSKDLFTIKEYLKHDPTSLEKVADHGPIRFFSVQGNIRQLIASDDWISEKLGETVNSRQAGNTPFSVQGINGKHYRILVSNAVIENSAYLITVAHNEESVRQTGKTLAMIILLALPIALAISLAIGYFLAGRVLAPISAITRKAEEISAENLSERLPVGESDDEFNRLATVFNQTFSRIEESFTRLKRFTADASHELRTPLAAIRSIGETALHQAEGEMECREAIGSILEETDCLRQMIEGLLLLSRADTNEIQPKLEHVDLAVLAGETVELLNVLAEEKRQTIMFSADKPVIVMVDRGTIRQALINLLDNAIKYSPAEAAIIIKVGHTDDNEPYISIMDNGIGIPEDDIQRIFDRFYRVDKGRSREMGGAGLGLAITKWAVEINKCKIEAFSRLDEGSEFRIVFQQQP